jgi:HNH endonuclease
MSTAAEQHLALGALKSAGGVHGALQPESVAIAALLGMGASYNPRRIDPDQLLALRRSLRTFGAVEPVVANRRTAAMVREFTRYTSNEDEQLRALAGHASADEMAALLGRPLFSVRSRLTVLGLRARDRRLHAVLVERTCATCGGSFRARGSKVRHHATRFCSKPCAHAGQRKPGRTKDPLYRGDDWPRVRREMLRKYGACWRCSRRATRLHVHHVIPWRNGGGNERENLSVLCASCHRHVEEATRSILAVVPDVALTRVLVLSELANPARMALSRAA